MSLVRYTNVTMVTFTFFLFKSNIVGKVMSLLIMGFTLVISVKSALENLLIALFHFNKKEISVQCYLAIT